MSAPVPSRRILRHLASLCKASRSARAPSRSASISSAFSRHASGQQTHQKCCPTYPICSQNRSRAFSTTLRRRQDNTAPLPDITNHYTLFPQTLPGGPPPSGPFTINLPSLKREFLHLQGLHHPDKYPDEPAHSKALALSALINTSYKTLSDPLLRAQYLLLQNYDIDVMSEDNSSHPTDQSTLIDVMDAQEAIEEASSHSDIESLLEDNQARIESTTKKMAEAFEQDNIEGAKNECVRLKYWRSLQDGLKDWEPGKEVRLIH